MRSSSIRSRLRLGQAARIAFMYYPTAMMPAYAAKAGYDAVCIDAEHNTWERREIGRMVPLHRLAGIDCMVRTGSRNPTELYRLLEDGVTALLCPLVNTPAEAATLAQAVRFPPLGQRGIDGAGMDNDYYVNGTTGYAAAANAETMLIVQIETPQAVACVDQIAATKGLDGLFIGPGDLALRLGCAPDWAEPKMQEAQAAVAAAAAKHGIAWGRPAGSATDISTLARMGGQLIAYGSDFSAVKAMMLSTYSQTLAEGLK